MARGRTGRELGFAEALKEIDELNRQYPQLSEARVVTENPDPDPTFLRVRGSWDRPGIEVFPSTPVVLPKAKKQQPTRLGLARWLFSEQNPLTARVAVNRIWQEYFGNGLVATSDDFGTQGDKPSHPELLDWLASEFRDSGWSVKHIHRLIVTSETYKQSSNLTEELQRRDPGNVLLARQTRMRLPAEFVWDKTLAVAGLINQDIGGRSFRPVMPAGTTGFKAGRSKWDPSEGRELYKRGMYIQFQRTQPYPFLMNFDSPEFREAVCRRDRSNTPLQALNLLNGPLFVEAWQALATRILTEPSRKTFEGRLVHTFRLALAREPSKMEYERFRKYWNDRLDQVESAGNKYDDVPQLEGQRANELLAWSGVSRILMNLDEFVTRP